VADAAQQPPLLRGLLECISDASLQRTLMPQYEALVEQGRQARPEPGSKTELEEVRALVLLGLTTLRLLGPRAVDVLREGVQVQLDALIHDELRTAEVTRKLALRHLQSSVEVAGKVVELFGELHRRLPAEALDELLIADTHAIAGYVDGGGGDLGGLMTWWLALSVALECTRGELDDLTYWSRRAIEGSRRVEALLPRLAAQLDTIRVELKARWAWAGWGEHEIENELKAWRELSE
jgi:hypothetical protein